MSSPFFVNDAGYLVIVNCTPFVWHKTHARSTLMNTWEATFPEKLCSWQSIQVFVEWTGAPVEQALEASGDVGYQLVSDGQPHLIEFQARGKTREGSPDRRLQIQLDPSWIGIYTDAIIERIGWQSNGYIIFTLSGLPGLRPCLTSGLLSNVTGSWMQDNLRWLGTRTLSQICLPGSHNSGMSEIGTRTAFATESNVVNHQLDILGQLYAGIRYFDIRPAISGTQFFTGHYHDAPLVGWQGANGQSIESIVFQLNHYCSTHQELIVLDLSHSVNTDIEGRNYRPFNQEEWERLMEILCGIKYRYPGLVYLHRTTLNDLIGPPISKSNGVHMPGQAAVLIIIREPVDLTGREHLGFFRGSDLPLFNQYSDTNDAKVMSADQLNKLRAKIAPWFLLSWTLTQSSVQSVDGSASILQLSRSANPRLFTDLLPVVSNSTFPNVLLIDGITDCNLLNLAMGLNLVFSKSDLQNVDTPTVLAIPSSGLPAPIFSQNPVASVESESSTPNK